MPPIRTAKTSSASTAPKKTKQKKTAPKISTNLLGTVVVNDHKDVCFLVDKCWDDRATRLTAATRKLSFGSGFVLTRQVILSHHFCIPHLIWNCPSLHSKHIDELVALGPTICTKLWDFDFIYEDVGYDAHNSAKELTDAAVTLLAQHCPSLRRVKLPGTSGLTHVALAALLEKCPNLTEVEITPASRDGINDTGSIFALLLERPTLAPKLRKLRLDSHLTKEQMKAMRAVTKQRDKLLVQLVSVEEVKKWGDWELEVHADNYRKGRIQTGAMSGPPYGLFRRK